MTILNGRTSRYPAPEPNSEPAPEPVHPPEYSDEAADIDSADQRRGPLRVAVFASNHPWREDFSAHVNEHEGRLELQVFRDPTLLSEQPFELVVIDDTVPYIEAVVAAAPPQTIVVGFLAPDGGGAGPQVFQQFGVDHIIPEALSSGELAMTLIDHAREKGFEAHSPYRLSSHHPPPPNAAHQPVTQPQADRRGPLTGLMTVGGPDSALAADVGAGFAAALTKQGQTVLIDLDPRRLLAPRLGLQSQPNVRDLASAIGSKRQIDPLAFVGRRHVSNVELPFWTFVGPATSGTDAMLSGIEAEAVTLTAADTFPYQIALIGDLRYSRAEQCVPPVELCTVLVGVAEPTPVALAELLDWYVAICGDGPASVPLHVVFAGEAQRSRLERLATELAGSMPASTILSTSYLKLKAKDRHMAQWQGELFGRSYVKRCKAVLFELTEAAVDREPAR